MRAVVAACVSLAFAACAPQVAPTSPSVASPVLSDSYFHTSDGLALPIRRWLPDAAPTAVILAVHGFNDYSKSFDIVPDAPGVGPTLAAQGFAVFAYDQRGFGAAPYAGFWPGEDRIVEDFSDFAWTLSKAYPDIPLYAIGVSMGGAVIIAALTSDDPPPINAAVLVAPAIWGRETMPLTYRAALWMGAHTMPWAKPSGRGFGRLASDNISMLNDAGRDPLFIKDTRIDSIYGLTNLMDRALSQVGNLSVPTLYIYGANDEIIPKNATEKALDRFLANHEGRRLGFYETGWHMMLRDLGAEIVLSDIASYLEDQAQPLPSSADTNALMRFKSAQN